MPGLTGLAHGLPAPVVLAVGALLIAAESGLLIGVLLPGASAAPALGVLARAGVAAPAMTAPVVAMAAVAGTQFGYLRGRLPATADRLPALPTGALSLGAAQWLVGLRTLAPRLAARAGVGHRRFSAVSVPSAACWGATMVLLGYLAGAAYQFLGTGLSVTGLVVIAALPGRV